MISSWNYAVEFVFYGGVEHKVAQQQCILKSSYATLPYRPQYIFVYVVIHFKSYGPKILDGLKEINCLISGFMFISNMSPHCYKFSVN